MPARRQIAFAIPWTNEATLAVARGAADFAYLHGLGLGLWERRLPEPEDVTTFGLLGCVAVVDRPAVAQRLRRLRIPVVSYLATGVAPAIPCVTTDDDAIARLALAHFRDQGFGRAACFPNGPDAMPLSAARAAAFARVAAAMGFPVVPGPGWSGSPPQRQRRLRAWVRAQPRPLAVFATHDRPGRRLIVTAAAAGIRVPQELAVVGVGNEPIFCGLATPPLSSVDANLPRVGYEAARLVHALHGGERPRQPLIRVPPAGLVVRGSSDTVAVPDPDVAAALGFIRDHVHRPLRVGEVLASVASSRSTLERRFRAILGRTPAEEIRRARLERATRLLAQTDWPLSQVALASGYRCFQHFATALRRASGRSPRAYRARHRGSTPA